MIISASRRTDIPAFYSTWFFNRIEEGFACVRNPMSCHQVSQVPLGPDVVDGIVFWTKNPRPMLSRLHELDERGYVYYFQFTLTGYGPDIERNVPDKMGAVIPVFQELSERIGKERVIWRYDPIFFTPEWDMDAHVRTFEQLAGKLAAYTEKCTISFLDLYKKTERNLAPVDARVLTGEEQDAMAAQLSAIAHSHGLRMDTCAEAVDLAKHGIEHARCIDSRLFERITGGELDLKKDKNQRLECGCVASVDIGAYNTCFNACRYCYANFSDATVAESRAAHDPMSPLILGRIEPDDKVTERKVKSNRSQARLPL